MIGKIIEFESSNSEILIGTVLDKLFSKRDKVIRKFHAGKTPTDVVNEDIYLVSVRINVTVSIYTENGEEIPMTKRTVHRISAKQIRYVYEPKN